MGGRSVGAAVPEFVDANVRKPLVRATRLPEALRAEAELASLFDQDEQDATVFERGQRALRAARALATARTRAEENAALTALRAIGCE